MRNFHTRGRCGLLALLTLLPLAGCSLCASPYDYDYSTYGGRTPRRDMRNGRVGSVFSDPDLIGSATGETIVDDDGIVVEEIESELSEMEIIEPE